MKNGEDRGDFTPEFSSRRLFRQFFRASRRGALWGGLKSAQSVLLDDDMDREAWMITFCTSVFEGAFLPCGIIYGGLLEMCEMKYGRDRCKIGTLRIKAHNFDIINIKKKLPLGFIRINSLLNNSIYPNLFNRRTNTKK